MNRHRSLMIVDVQRAFEPPQSFVERLRRYARRFPCRVFTQFINPAGSMFRKILKQKNVAQARRRLTCALPPSLAI